MSNPKTVRATITMSAELADYLESVLIVGNDPGEDTHPGKIDFVEQLIAKLQKARHDLDETGAGGTGFDLFQILALPEPGTEAYAKYEETGDERLRTVM
jgi:hypothetical protein